MSDPLFIFTSTNPFGLGSATPTFVDIDDDGDLDAFVDAQFFRNIGTANNPVFATPIINPFGLSDVSGNANPAFVDIDGDGDFDAFVGDENYYSVEFFENTGTSSTPAFAASIDRGFGLRSQVGGYSPTFADIDGDGDFDAFVGGSSSYRYLSPGYSSGRTQFYENTGTISRPVFEYSGANLFGLDVVDIRNNTPTFVDIDGDGDLDAFVGKQAYGDFVVFFRNTGTVNNPVFTSSINPFGLRTVHDGDYGGNASPTFADIDDDGDLDAFIGDFEGRTIFSENTGTANNPIFSASSTLPIDLGNEGHLASPTLADIDGDGDLDAFVGNNPGNMLFFENTGTASIPIFAPPSTNPFGLSQVSYSARLTFADIDDDGDLDAFVIEGGGNMLFFENTGTASIPLFAAPSTNPFGLTDMSGLFSPTFADIDGDGDLDALVGNGSGNTLFFENTGTASIPLFTAPSTNPFGLIDVGHLASPALADIDGDGDLDVFVGNSYGNTLFFENTGTVSRPAFFSSINPFGLTDMSGLTSPTFADIDGDGDLDAFVDGRFFVNNDSSTNGVLLVSTPGNDILTGTLSNNDTVSYASAASAVTVSLLITAQQNTMGAGLDTLTSIENLLGSNYNDKLTGNSKANTLEGGTGNDMLIGCSGADTMIGGLGNDIYSVDNAADVIVENFNEGNDLVRSSVTYKLSANVENLTLRGELAINGTGNYLDNILRGNSGANQLYGRAGNDTLNGLAGADTLVGGLGNDIYSVDNVADVIIENFNEGDDLVRSSVTYKLSANVENLTLRGELAINGTGNYLDNILRGNSGANQLYGRAGNDTLNGLAGADTLVGGLGNDTYSVDNAADVIIENFNEGDDLVRSSVTYKLSANVENLTLRGELAINGTGNYLDNILRGNSGANQLYGQAGNDTLNGLAGADTLTGGAGKDIFKLTTANNIDTITDFVVVDDTIQLENSVFAALTTTGKLAFNQFRIGTKALDANDFIVYNKATGVLLYDADGSGAGAAVEIATVGVNLAMTNADIMVI